MHPLETRRLLPQDLKPIVDLKSYIAQGGGEGLKRARAMTPDQVIGEIKNANLRGRGGAGFPTAIKWGSVRNEPCPVKYIACNGAEGEPGTFKDRYLLRLNPYLVLEGMLIAIQTIGARAGFIGIKKRFVPQVNRLINALREIEEAGWCEPGLIEIVLGPDEYLFGEEKALLEVIDGRGAMPRILPPYIQGLRFTTASPNPTCVNNVESYSQVALIMRNGADWFKQVGSQDTPGTIMFTISGDVKRPGVYELPAGLPVKTILNDVAGGPAGQYPFKALFSGVASGVLTPERFDTPADFGSLRKAGGGLGSAGFIVYDESACMVQVALKYSNFLALSSCGQCIPCNKGTATITRHLRKFEDGLATQDDLDAVYFEAGRCTNQTRCFLPTQESILVPSVLKYFPNEFKNHIGRTNVAERDLVLPKLADFDEATRVFSYDDPKKFALIS